MKAPLICDTHREQIKYFCTAQACYYLPLCDICVNEHRSQHAKLQLISTKKAFHFAEANLQKHQNDIQKYLGPLTIRQNMMKIIQKQKEDLQKQKLRLIQFIKESIDKEIRLLEANNDSALNKDQVNMKRTLELKLQELDGIGAPGFDGKVSLLRKGMNFQIKAFMDQIAGKYNQIKQHTKGTGRSRKFKVFQTTHHEIMLSPLELRERAHQKARQIKRTMNESPLYFLIDQNMNTSNLIYSLSPEQKKMFVYNIDYDDWTTHFIPMPVTKQAAGVHDHRNNRFFWIGGVQTAEKPQMDLSGHDKSFSFGPGGKSQNRPSQRSSRILAYEPQKKQKPWRYLETRLNIPRSSCQAVMIQDRDDPNNYGIIVSGGFGPNGEVLKSSEFIDLSYLADEAAIMLQDTNFGAFAGTLVTYNKTNVLRIGGLYKNKTDYAVVEVVERLDCTEWIKGKGKPPRWSYVELLVPDFQRNDKVTLFHANQAAVQINPNEIFIFGGITSGFKGSADSFIIGIEEFQVTSRSSFLKSGNKEQRMVKQYKFTVRWANEKPLITGDDFSGQSASIWKGKMHILQNTGSQDMVNFQKRLLSFDMYEWSETEDILPE